MPKFFSFIFIGLFSLNVAGQSSFDELNLPIPSNDFLEVDDAFAASANYVDGEVIVRWKIAPDYYLYKHRIDFVIDGGKITDTFIPEGKEKDDPYFGLVEVYFNHLETSATVAVDEDSFSLDVSYQGCASAGLCYPPETRRLNFKATDGGGFELVGGIQPAAPRATTKTVATTETSAETAANSDQDVFTDQRGQLSNILQEGNWLWIALAFLGAGLLLTFTPCVLPMIPILSSIIAGQGKEVTTKKALALSFVYVQSMAFTYAIFGILVAQAGGSLSGFLQSPPVLIGVSILFILLALSMFGLYELQLPQFIHDKLHSVNSKQGGGSYLSVAVMGVLATMVVSPCTSAPLTAALLIIAQKGDVVTGGFSLYMLGLGMGVPLLLLGAGEGRWLPKAGTWMDSVKAVFGYMMLAMSLYITKHLMPDGMYLGLWALLLGHASYRYGAFRQVQGRAAKVGQVIARLLLALAIVYAVGAAYGNNRLLSPLDGLVTTSDLSEAHLEFEKVGDLAQLQQRLAQAKSANQPVMVDFFAEWCVACYEFEDYTFRDKAVQDFIKANNVLLIQADVTENDAVDREMLQHYKVLGLPTIMFFTSSGVEQTAGRATGFEPADIFLKRMKSVYSRN